MATSGAHEQDPPDGEAADYAAVLADLRRDTHRRVDTLRRDLDDIIERSNDASRDDEHDPEGATIAFERAQVAALLEAAQVQLREIRAAEQRLEHGEHGRCERCRGNIPRERLRARPIARTCVDCSA